ncbi:LSM domain-containing protein [Spironucleus salmonicida]|uniref:Sm protein G n=1 Tax=Spironucleus salmonicida TaxID=348837 RepID=V6LW42_9EUKA|nr:LSM domain-containing protein [Spironucleus salmonicida]|eukprot:EST48847.1 Small nuclear ribonucleoprotein [Spironucleus salmonicida]
MSFQLKHHLNTLVSIKLNDKSTISGILLKFDNFMNVVLKQATCEQNNIRRDIGLVVLKGDNISYIIPTSLTQKKDVNKIVEPVQKSIIPGLVFIPGLKLNKK